MVTVVCGDCGGDVTPLSGQTSDQTITSTGLQLSFSSLAGSEELSHLETSPATWLTGLAGGIIKERNVITRLT